MATRRDDTIRLDSVQGGDFAIVVDRATTYEVNTSFVAPSEARFELGDESSWSALQDAIAIGTRYVVYVNDRPRLKGRLLARRLPLSAERGSTIQLSVRTRMADAWFTSCEPKLNFRKATLKDVVLAAYEQLGLTEADFIFESDLAREVLTGRSGSGKPPPDLTAMKEDQAKPQPPETVQAFVERHLNRFHLSHWDGPNGEIVVGAPNDTQAATYIFRARRNLPEAQSNNILDCEKCEDFEETPTGLWVFGAGGGKQYQKSKVKWLEADPTLVAVDPSLDRRMLVVDQNIKTQAQAEARARREMSLRSLQTDSWRINVDGWSHWTGSEQIPYAIDTVGDVQIDTGPKPGPYLVHSVSMKGDAQGGNTSELMVVAKGIWRL